MTGILSMGPSTARFSARKGKVEGRASAEKTVAPGSAEQAAAPRSNTHWSFVAGALAHLRLSAGEPRERPLASIRARHAALGFPRRRRPRAAARTKPERDCDCVPWQW